MRKYYNYSCSVLSGGGGGGGGGGWFVCIVQYHLECILGGVSLYEV